MSFRKLSHILQERAKSELNEVPERIPDDVEYIKEWLKKEIHLDVMKDDQFFLTFLRSCKFSLQRTKEKLDLYFTIKTITPEFFHNRDPFRPEIQEILSSGIFIPITKGVEEAGLPTKYIIKWDKADPNKHNFLNIIKVGLMIMELLSLECDNIVISGLEILHDMNGFQLGYMTQVNPVLCKKALYCMQKAFPARIKGVFFFNTPPHYEVFINIFKPFASEKLLGRLKISRNQDFSNLYDDLPISCFPKEYGGENGTLHEIAVEWKKKLENYSSWFEKDALNRTIESKRVGHPLTSAEIFGVEGSFRKLEVD